MNKNKTPGKKFARRRKHAYLQTVAAFMVPSLLSPLSSNDQDPLCLEIEQFSTDAQDSCSYEIECCLKRRYYLGEFYYFVKWVDRGWETVSWEPETDIDVRFKFDPETRKECIDKLREYESFCYTHPHLARLTSNFRLTAVSPLISFRSFDFDFK